MTKTFLLAATAITAIAFGGAAQAGTITGTVNTKTVAATSAGVTTVTPYTIATEATDPTAAVPVSSAAGAVVLTNTISNTVAIPASATPSFTITFDATGAGRFDISTAPVISLLGTTGAGAAAPFVLNTDYTIQATTSGATPTTISYLVTFLTNASARVLQGYSAATALTSTSEADLSVGSSLNQIVGGASINIDSAAATRVVRYSAALGAYSATVNNVLAGLPAFTAFKNGTAANQASLSVAAPAGQTVLYRTATATGFSVAANASTTNAGGVFYRTLANGTDVANASTIISGATVVVTGTNLDKLTPKVGTVDATPATLTPNLAQFVLGASAAASSTFSLTESATAPVVLQAGTYTASIQPAYATNYVAPASPTSVSLLTVALDGTNFTAPWFTLNNANNNATLRLANNGTSATGPVIISLKANNGTTAATTPTVTVANSIAAGATLDIVGSNLATLLGTNAQNGDLQVTVQGDGAVISGKVRIRNIASGATFEASLGTLGAN